MTKVIVDDAFAPALQGSKNPLKLFDNSGRFLGHFVPSPSADEIRAAEKACPYTEEELNRMRNAVGGKSLDAFWEEMGRE